MSPQARRGRRIYLVLGAILVGLQLSGVLSALIGSDQVQWWKSVIRPLILAGVLVWLWWGDQVLRWMAAGTCFLQGALPLYGSAHLAYRLAEVTPPGQADFLTKVLGPALTLLAAYGLFYLITGAVILFSPSLTAFFKHQRSIASGDALEFVYSDDRPEPQT